MSVSTLPDPRLLDTQRAFDSVAAVYDGPVGNNALIQQMRYKLWSAVTAAVPKGGRLLDLGCGTGIDAVYFASQGYEVVATDWSPEMAARTRARAQAAGTTRVRVEALGIQDLAQLVREQFDGIYSDLGPLNCIFDLHAVAHSCAALLQPGGILVASVIGRVCPWEFAYYAARLDLSRARLRGTRESVPVNLNRQRVWTRYYAPREFYGAFAGEFELVSYRPLALFMPPPYLIRFYERAPGLFAPLRWLDEHVAGLPGLRDMGDHFIMVLKRR